MKHIAILCLGSNIGNARACLHQALEALDAVGCVRSASEAYTTPDDTGRGNAYTNMVVSLATESRLDRLCDFLHSLETAAGRIPASKAMAVMPLDIDIVVWDGTIISPYDYSRPYFTRGYARIQQLQPRHISE